MAVLPRKNDRRTQVTRTWAVYAKLRPSVMVEFPTKQQQLGLGALCFDYLLQYRLVYTGCSRCASVLPFVWYARS